MVFQNSQFAQRLSEVIAWCAHHLGDIPDETAEYRKRICIWSIGVNLYHRGTLLKQEKPVHRWLLEKMSFGPKDDPDQLVEEGRSLMTKGDVADILPLNQLLRSSELKPGQFVPIGAPRTEVLEELANKREKLLRQSGLYPDRTFTDLANGKLLSYQPAYNVCDGASQHISKGFFDPDDAPPWDCWICYSEGTLFSWVPPQLLDYAQEGIKVNPVDSIHWATKSDLDKLVRNFGAIVKTEDMTHP